MRLNEIGGNTFEHLNLTGKSCCPRNFKDHCPASLLDSDVILVGEAPGEVEVDEQLGFTGPSGKLLRNRFAEIGITNPAVTNIVKCRPKQVDGKQQPPTKGCIDCCMNKTAREIKDYPFVVLVGSTAMNAFFPKARNRNLRGNAVHHPDYPGQRFYSIYHPSWALRIGQRGKEIFDNQIARFGRIYHEDEPEFELVRAGAKNFWERFEQALESPKICLDLETNALESWHLSTQIEAFAFTHNGETVFFVHRNEAAFVGAMDRLKDYLANPSKQVINQHVGFDLDMVEQKERTTVSAKQLDTGVLWHHARGYKMPSLKYLVAEELDGYRHMVYLPHECEDVDLLAKYNAEDVIYPWRLFEKGVPELDPHQLDLYLRVHSPSDLFLQRITSNGIYYDAERWEEIRDDLLEQRENVVQQWLDEDSDAKLILRTADQLPDPKDSVLRGDKELHRYLFQRKNLPVVSETDKGNKSTDKNAIQEWISKHGWAQGEHLLEIRRLEKLLSQYVWGFAEHIEADGRIHSDYLNTWTDSGRWSSRSPNMQNIARNNKIRSMFAAPPGKLFVEADYSQIELRIMLSLCGDDAACQAYYEGVDAHARTAKKLHDVEEYTKEQRSQAKPVNFGLIYGGDGHTVQRQAKGYGYDWSRKKADRFAEKFFEIYPKLKGYHEEVLERLRSNRGWVQDATGMVHRYKKWDSDNDAAREHVERSAINAMGQGPASFMTAYTGILAQQEMRDRGLWPEFRLVNTVHDSLCYEVPEDGLQELIEILTAANEVTADWTRSWLNTPLVLEFEVGAVAEYGGGVSNWGELKELDYKAAA